MKQFRIMKKPIHPGKLLNSYLKELTMTPSKAAALMDLSREVIANIAECRSRISPYVALKLSKGFETTPEFWLDLQMKYDLYSIRTNVFIPNIAPLKDYREKQKTIYPKKQRIEWMLTKRRRRYTTLVRRNYPEK